MSDASSDQRFNYQNIAPPVLPAGTLDEIAKKVFDPKPGEQLGVWGNIVNGLYLILAVAYLIAREKLIKAQQEIVKQQYEQGQAAGNQNEIEKDPLGSEKR